MALQTLRPDRGDCLPNPSECPNSIVLVLGGPMGVNERHQPDLHWLQTELNWLMAWHRQSRPVLGICLGAQLLAVAAGGCVKPLQVGAPPQQLKELDWAQSTGLLIRPMRPYCRDNRAAAWCCIGMAIASTCQPMQPCWVPRCTVRNRCFESAITPLACNATSRSTETHCNTGSPTTTPM